MQKGEYGYRKIYKQRMGTVILLFLMAIVLQYIAARTVRSEWGSNMLTLTAILTVLPMANLAAPFLAIWAYRTPDRVQKNRVDVFSKKGLLLYDLIVTFREMILPLDYCLVREGQVILYLSKGGKDLKKAKTLITENFRLNQLSLEVCIYDDFERFLAILEGCASTGEISETASGAAAVLKSLSV